MRNATRLILAALFILCGMTVLDAAAQAPTGPGSGHGFLIDKHTAKGVSCATCHSAAPPPAAPAMTVCFGCHGSYPQLAEKTAKVEPNPHSSHQGDLPCESCHHVHKASEVFCDQCHSFGLTAP